MGETRELSCECSAPVQAQPERPSPMYQDVRCTRGVDHARLDFIVFRNHYVASIEIYQRQTDGDGASWVQVLGDERLMAHPHFEDDAQAWHTLYTSHFRPKFDARLFARAPGAGDAAPLGSLRISLRQPSMMWSAIELRHVRCYMSVPGVGDPEALPTRPPPALLASPPTRKREPGSPGSPSGSRRASKSPPPGGKQNPSNVSETTRL